MRRPKPIAGLGVSFVDLFSCAFVGMMLIVILTGIEQSREAASESLSTTLIVPYDSRASSAVSHQELTVKVSSGRFHRQKLVPTGDSSMYRATVFVDNVSITGDVDILVAPDATARAKLLPSRLHGILAETTDFQGGYQTWIETIDESLEEVCIFKNEDYSNALDAWIKADDDRFKRELALGRDELLRVMAVRLTVLIQLRELLASARLSTEHATALRKLTGRAEEVKQDLARCRSMWAGDRSFLPLSGKNAEFVLILNERRIDEAAYRGLLVIDGRMFQARFRINLQVPSLFTFSVPSLPQDPS